ncbi:MAG: O-antigen ligase family protein [Candidatus Nealsonbacteria bacterium]|nr:O-antigen ligase family protein [Candidatus Nealsonbacteria bacterium]
MGKASREKKERRLQDNDPGSVQSFPRSTLWEKVCFGIVEWGTYLVLFTPLILNRNYFFPYVVPKTIFFRVIVDLILIAYLLLVTVNRRYLPRLNVLTIGVAVFLGISLLTAVTGVNFERSFWSTFERMGGVLTLLHLFIFFVVLTGVFQERKYWERIFAVSIAVGTFLSLSILLSKDPTSRGGGSIGNSSFMAAYMLFNVFFSLILFLTKGLGWKIFTGITFLIMAIVVFFNPIEETRGAMGAFAGGVFLLILGYMIFSKSKLLVRLAPIILVSGVLLGIVFTQTEFFKANMFDVKQLPGRARALVWGEGWEAWKEKPLLGWGPENFNVAFTKYFKAEVPLTVDIWYDRVHNVVIDSLVSSGIIGLLSYLFIFGAAVWGLLRTCRKVAEKKNLFLPLGMIVILATYFAQNIWVFDMISTYLMFFLSLAFISFLISSSKQASLPEPSLEQRKFSPLLGSFLIILALGLLYFGNIQPARASQMIIKGLVLEPDQAIGYFEKALKVSPMAQLEAPEQLSRRTTDLFYGSNPDRFLLEKAADLAAKELEKTILKNPQDFRYFLLLGRLYNDWYNQGKDPAKLDLADKFLTEALKLSQENQQGYWALAQTRLFQGRNKEAIELLQKAIDLEPRYGPSHWYQALSYKVTGESKLGAEKTQDAEAAGYNWKNNLGELKSVIEIYQELGDDAKLAELYSLAVEKDQNDAKLWAGLAASQANIGKYPEAREAAQKAIALKPDFVAELENFLKSLPQ